MEARSVPQVIDRQHLFEELVDVLIELRSGRTAPTLAQVLVRADYDGDLVALVAGGDRAVFFRPGGRVLVSYPFDAGGVDECNSETLWRRVGDPAAWVDAHCEAVDWVHPRYRWVLELGAEESSWYV